MCDRHSLTSAPLWAITSYYNPSRFQRRRLNYRLFRHYLEIPLLAVEISFGADFELSAPDADLLLQLRDGDVMWQKERLLNIAVRHLPATCRKVVWLDCDTVIRGEDWLRQVERALDEYPLVQPFQRVYHQARDAHRRNPLDPSAAEFVQESIPRAVAAGIAPAACLNGVRDRMNGSYVMGMGWAMNRPALEECGLYDACIIGGGMRAFVSAAYGCFAETVRLNQMNARQADHYLAWARRFFPLVQGKVGAVEADLFHLWHGCSADRRYKDRYEGLLRFDFDPAVDLALAADETWRWNSAKSALHQYVRDYFDARKEDG